MNTLLESIKKHEGFMSRPYRDSVGKLTIGYGFNLEDNQMTEEEAEFLLRSRVRFSESAAGQFTWFRKLNRHRQEVVIEMIYNMGLPVFLTFKKMIQALRDDDFEEAAYQMMDSKWAEQVGQRAETLSDKMAKDSWANLC